MKKLFILLLLIGLKSTAQKVTTLNIGFRNINISLNGKWQYIIDPYETGFYNYRWIERAETDREAYWNSDLPDNKTDRKEHGYTSQQTLNVPGDWNSQAEKFLYYEGTVWYKKTFDLAVPLNKKVFLHFGACNYKADVFLNGKKLGSHKGGFTPFSFEIEKAILKPTNNWLVVKVDNKRSADEVPTLNTDWWNYGGITRDVSLVFVPENHIVDYHIQLDKKSLNAKDRVLEGWVKLSGQTNGNIAIVIPQLKINKQFAAHGDSLHFKIPVKNLQLWAPENPKLYEVQLSTATDKISDKVGFKIIETRGKTLLLNGSPVFLRGICIHEEMPQQIRRAYSKTDALQLLQQAKQLNVNMVRLAHYPHNEYMLRMADSLGLMVWAEIPVYWTINFKSQEVLNNAKIQLKEMIHRDHNRASIIIWSVGNETPVHQQRTDFMKQLVLTAKSLDSTRLVSAALEYHKQENTIVVDDPLGQYTDVVSVNEYLGWYGAQLPNVTQTVNWQIKYNKPFFISETGAEALGTYHADSLTRWSEEYQEWYYKEQIGMLKRMPANFVGITPWILNDFRSPKRNNPKYQQGWNNKGLYDQKGNKKKAFYVMKAYYDEMQKKYETGTELK